MLSADQSRRKALSRSLSLPFFLWRYGGAPADQLLIVPQDLRTADPSFWREVEAGYFGLAGSIAVLKRLSPFDIEPPAPAWARALHGFGWLLHLEAAEEMTAREMARQLVMEWVERHQAPGGVAWRADVSARRLISWLSHANLLLDGAEPRIYDAVAASLGLQVKRLAAKWRDSPQGHPRLLTLAALVLADLCVAGHDRELDGAQRAFSAELSRQILPDGGHLSRDPAVIVELLLDLLPLHQCFNARGKPPPKTLTVSIRRMLLMLRYLRLGDGLLARFNGMGVPSPACLATVLAYDDAMVAGLARAGHSNYVRLERGNCVVLMDTGSPPPLEYACGAHAGCLSFEMTSGNRLLFANGGAPGPADADWLAAARATASHNTLCLADTASAELIRDAKLEALIGGMPIRFPDAVKTTLSDVDGAARVDAVHNGYAKRFGLLHRRMVTFAADGRLIEGVDRMEAAPGLAEGASELPYAIHFHLHPDATCYHADPGVAAEIVLRNEHQWRFAVEGAYLSIEESVFFSDSSGPRPASQIVLRGSAFAGTEIRWRAAARD